MPEKSLPVVTLKANTSTGHSIATSTTDTPLSVVTSVGATSAKMMVSTTTTTTKPKVSEKTKPMKCSRVFNKPIEIEPTVDTPTPTNKQTQGGTDMDSGPTVEESDNTSLLNKYYEVLTPEQDDIVYISHSDIIKSRCTVSLNRISEDKITKLTTSKHDTPSQMSSSESTEPTDITKKPCYRLKRKPSRARVRAQQIITARNKNKNRQEAVLIQLAHSVSCVIPPEAEPEPDEPVISVSKDSSDDTILYTPPSSPKKKKKKKQVAKFVIRTVGLKMHRDTETVKEKRNRNFKCYLCGENFSSTRLLNTHFKIDHEGLDCLECGKEFNSPLMLKKHSYIHKLCSYICS